MNKFFKPLIISVMTGTMLISCKTGNMEQSEQEQDDFEYFVEQFDDIRVLRYKAPDFDELPLGQKEYIYYLSEAAKAGRDILWDQNFKYNLLIRKTLEAIIQNYSGNIESDEYKAFLKYSKKVFFANGIHHHYSSDKFKPEFSESFFKELVNNTKSGLPIAKNQTPEKLAEFLSPIIFDESLYSKKVEQRTGMDMVAGSASNFYEGLTEKEAIDFYSKMTNPDDPQPISVGLNSKLKKSNGVVIEEVYKSGGKYGPAIDVIITWLDKAKSVAPDDYIKNELELLIEYYKTGDLKTWDEYNVAWAKNTDPSVDYINGFIETYEDPLGMKATWEAIVNYTDPEASKRTKIITQNAQWFEVNSPIEDKYKKEKVTGIAARVINIAMLGGDCYPASPLGINLPNADWIRKEVGSKSVTLANITSAIDKASQGNGFLEEFASSEEEINRIKKYSSISDPLHTDLHECVGHASGKLAVGTDPNALKNYASPLEEARADLFALYYMMDRKVIDLGLLPAEDAAKAAYDGYIRNGLLTQIVRIKPGKEIEQAHMRSRSTIAHWVYENGKKDNVVELFQKDGKTYVRINDYKKLQGLFGNLLKEIQRIKSEGDYEAGKSLIENYGVKIDPQLHNEILGRYAKLNLAPYTGFINPVIKPEYDEQGRIINVVIEYVDDYLGQMLEYGRDYSFLPVEN
ncbi:MAG TPA: dihydrofolate reductase [Bacteroidales bacterium]|nr:dihydrofolate reductase [Bacteroidales bacterium]